jgi:hypothetical protein
MKKPLPLLLILGCLLFFSSCSKVVYTNQQVLQSFHTKNDVTKRFGNPENKSKGDGLEVWTYKFNKDTTTRPQTNIASQSDTLKAYVPTAADSLKLRRYAERHDKYIKFMFDTTGTVAGYKSNGVNLSTTKKDNFGTGLLKVLGITAAIVVIVAVEIADNSDISL